MKFVLNLNKITICYHRLKFKRFNFKSIFRGPTSVLNNSIYRMATQFIKMCLYERYSLNNSDEDVFIYLNRFDEFFFEKKSSI